MITFIPFRLFLVLSSMIIASCGLAKKDDNKNTSTEQSTPSDQDANRATISGTLKFLVSDAEKGIVENAPVSNATVFAKGFPDQAITTDAAGTFTLAITLPKGGTLTDAGADYEVIGWTIIDEVKYGAQKKAENVLPDEPFDIGDIMIGYTQKLKFYPQYRGESDQLKDVDHRLCKITLIGYEGKSSVMVATTADGDLAVDYLPPATYQYAASCEGYAPYKGEFTVEFDQTTAAAWVAIPPFEITPVAP
jgi:hypothetical protein